jgi:Tfp pilus assembly protein PilO
VSRRAPLFAGIAFFLLALVGVFLLVLPKMSDVEDAEGRLDEARNREVALQAELSQLQAAAENAEELRRELARFQRAVPPVADLPGVINELQTAADVAGVDFFSISPGDPVPVPAGGAAEVPTQLQVIGEFFPVDEFLFRLETLHRISKVTNIALTEGPDSLPQIQLDMEVRFYTTDVDAGPGAAVPAAGGAPAEEGAATATPSPAASPAAAAAPTTPGA